MGRLAVWASASFALTAALLMYAWHTRVQFFPAMVFLATSKVSIVILINTVLVLTLILGQGVKGLFLGSLRLSEVEYLREKVQFAVIDTCLALTIFREELNIRVFAMFTALIFFKIFHWLAEKRQLHLEVQPASTFQHFR